MKQSYKLWLFIMSLVLSIAMAQSQTARIQDEAKYQELKAKGLLPQPAQVVPPGPHIAAPFAVNPQGDNPMGLLVPLDSSFSIVPFLNGTPGNQYRNDDGTTDSIPLSFTFRFFGSQWHNIYINNNGNISFGEGYSSFTSTGFPSASYRMLAAFWADVDTRALQSGVVWYKSEQHRFTIIWDRVGYFPNEFDKLNAFEIIITDGTDPLIGLNNNVAMSYGDMQWTTGSASGGIGGFGGTAATVGVNKGDGTNFAQIGRFDHEGSDYNGPNNPSGVSYLDNKLFVFSIAQGLGTIEGTFFRDDDASCTQGLNEPGLAGWTVRVVPGNMFSTTDSSGHYFFSFLPPNTYTISEILRPNWNQVCPTAPGTRTVVLDSGQTRSGLDFGNRPIANVQDLSISVAGGIARPGFFKYYGIRYDNRGTVAVSNVTVKFYLDQHTTHVQASPGGVYQLAGYVLWNFGSVAAGATGWLWEKVQIQPSTPLNTPLSTYGQIEPFTGDVNVADNRDGETQIVRGSFDPNDKTVTPQGRVLSTDTLEYLLRFQNVGTDTAFNIRVSDSLDANLSIGTVIPGASSSPYLFTIVSNELTFRFNDINLVDSTHNEAASHGFVKFKILPLSTAPVGTIIRNKGAIYFDFNAPVFTNTVADTIAGYTVYPGDANNDGVVDVRDILPLGHYFGATGPVRTGGSLTWGPQSLASPWTPVDAGYADCNGDGTVNANDVSGIIQNWYRTPGSLDAPNVDRRAVCEALLREIDQQQSVSGGMLEIRNAVVSYMKTELGVVFTYALEQNWPNPFNPSTTIQFSVRDNTPLVTLSVYNLLGQLVWEMKLADVLAGKHEVVWSGETVSGAKAASSVYLYRLTAGSFTSVKRMLLIK